MLPAATFQARSLMALVNLLPPENLQYVKYMGVYWELCQSVTRIEPTERIAKYRARQRLLLSS
jgi:hypothetical protein